MTPYPVRFESVTRFAHLRHNTAAPDRLVTEDTRANEVWGSPVEDEAHQLEVEHRRQLGQSDGAGGVPLTLTRLTVVLEHRTTDRGKETKLTLPTS